MKKISAFILIILFLLFIPTTVSASELKLSTPKKILSVGETFKVDINLTGAEATLGTDIIINYDPSFLEAISLEEGSLYPSYQPLPAKRISGNQGKIFLSGSANIGQPVKAEGIFGTTTFKSKKPGNTVISFDYDKTATNKTGVINFSGQNLLSGTPDTLPVDISSPNPVASFLKMLFSPFSKFFQQFSKQS